MPRRTARHRRLAQTLTQLVGDATHEAAPHRQVHVQPHDAALLVRMAQEHRVLGLLHPAFGQLEITPDAVRDLHEQRFWVMGNHMKHCAGLGQVAHALDSAAVRWLVFKGPVLAELAYPSPEMRPYGDLDILVHPLDLPAALEALQDAGAQLLDVNWPLIQAQCRGELTLLLAGGSYVDLHWHVVNERADRRVFRMDPAAMIERCTHHDLGGVRVPTLDPADTVLHLALHAARSGGHLLQWMVDLVFAMRWLHPGPRLLRERADQSGVNLPLAVMLARSWRTLGAPWPLQAIDELGADRTWRRFVGAADVVLPPGRPLDEGWTWQTILRATRGTTPASAAALAVAFSQRVGYRSGDQRPDERTPEGVNPLHVANGTRADRRRYLADVAAEWEHMHSARG